MALKGLDVFVCIGIFLLLRDGVYGETETILAFVNDSVTFRSTQTVTTPSYGYFYFYNGSSSLVRVDYTGTISRPSHVSVTMSGYRRYSSYRIYSISITLLSAQEDYSNVYTWRSSSSSTAVNRWLLYVIEPVESRNMLTIEAGTSINVYDFPHLSEDIIRRMGVRDKWSVDGNSVYPRYSHVNIDADFHLKNITYELTDDTGNTTAIIYVLNVTYISDIQFVPPAPYYVLNTNSVIPNVSCQTNCSPNCEVVWKKKGVLVFNTETLSLGLATTDNAGEYLCTATNTATGKERTRSFFISVSENWNVVFEPMKSTYFLKENDIVPNVRCTSECYPTCQTYWSKNGVNIGSTSTLALGKADTDDQGEYICTVRNNETEKQISRSLHIFVQEILEIEFQPKKTIYYLNAEEDIPSISCIFDCSSNCKMSWKKDGQLMSTASTLSLGKADVEKAGEYICEVTSYKTGKALSRNLEIIVQETWQIMFEPMETTYYLSAYDEVSEINCTSDCSSTCTVSWMKNGQKISNTSTLSLATVNTGKAGEYICELSSDKSGKTWSRSLYIFIQDERRVQRLEWFVIILSGIMGVAIIAVIVSLIFVGRKRISGAIQEARPAITSARKRISSFIPRNKPIRKTGEKTKGLKTLEVHDNQEIYLNEEPSYIYMMEENPGYFSNKQGVTQPEEVYEIIS